MPSPPQAAGDEAQRGAAWRALGDVFRSEGKALDAADAYARALALLDGASGGAGERAPLALHLRHGGLLLQARRDRDDR